MRKKIRNAGNCRISGIATMDKIKNLVLLIPSKQIELPKELNSKFIKFEKIEFGVSLILYNKEATL